MANESIHLKVGVPSDNAQAFEALMNDLVGVVQSDPGTLVYEWYAVADGDGGETWHILERYANAADGDKHVKGFAGIYAGRFMSLIDGCEAVVSDNATPYIRGVLECIAPVYISQRGGLNRF